MRYWTRELMGWLLVVLGLLTFFACYRLLSGHYILEGGSLTLIGIFLFRGGIHLLKVAMAARVCQEARERVEPRPAPAGGLPARPRPLPGVPRSR
jgi:hypothetical protein